MAEVTREEMVEAVRFEVDERGRSEGFWKNPKDEAHWNALKAALRELEAGGWRPIESAPKDRKFLAWNGIQVFFGDYLHGKFFTSQGQDGRSAPPPTHWMPLPAPPGTSDGSDK